MSARRRLNGSLELIDVLGTRTRWRSAEIWADEWLTEWSHQQHGPASEFIDEMTRTNQRGVIRMLALLAVRASAVPEELAWVGAGPLEDLVSHDGHGATIIDEVERVASRVPAFKAAVANVWVGERVEAGVRQRLVALGARDVTRPN